MDLKQTYEREDIHQSWENVYRANPLQDQLNATMMDRILKYLKPAPEARFLDAGCGVGYHALAIARRGFRCIGVDISRTILRQAADNAARMGLAGAASFHCQHLEHLDFADATFDAVHCRGVLMHIPRWEKALAELCRVLKPGGKIVLMEANTQALETCLVRLVRHLKNCRSQMVRAPGGLEFWSEKEGQAFVVRIADIDYLVRQMAKCGVRCRQRLATEFWDIYRFPPGLSRDLVIRFNRLWFALRLPSFLSVGNGIIGEKK